MNLELDHVFILTDQPKAAGDLLVSLGLEEGFSRDHKGQGTSNRRFVFANGMLELLYLRDVDESNNGPAKGLRLPERVQTASASPFGVVLTRTNDFSAGMPFSGWSYQPDYFEPPNAFHVGENSSLLGEPLCIYVPFIGPVTRREEIGTFKSISNARISVPLAGLSDTLSALQSADRLEVVLGNDHLLELTLDNGRKGSFKDLRPVLPLILHW